VTLTDAIQEARAIDGRAQGALLPSFEDLTRAMELVQVFSEAVENEPTEERRWLRARYIVAKLR
jgi:hypothetical protein